MGETQLDDVKQQLLVRVARAALLLDTTPEVIYDRSWRARVGLRAVKIGRSTRVRVGLSRPTRRTADERDA